MRYNHLLTQTTPTLHKEKNMSDSAYAIELSDINFAYSPQKSIFADFHWSVEKNLVTGLVGENGSGKTTLVHLVLGLLSPNSGRMIVNDREICSQKDVKLLRQEVGFLFQDSDSQLFSLTVEDDISFGPKNMELSEKEVSARVSEALKNLNIEELRSRTVHNLSGGEKRLVALCTILAMNPRIIILDEPSICLDPRGKRRLLEIIRNLNCTIVLLSHDMEFVREACDRVHVLSRGTIVANGKTDDVLSNNSIMIENGLEVPYSLRRLNSAPQ